MVEVGSMYLQGDGVGQKYTKAREYFVMAANKGSADGMLGVGSLYRDGRGVGEDYEKAAEWFTKAANKGSVAGMLALGGLYREGGERMGQDYKKSMQWFRKAAYEGSSQGAHAIAHLYFTGGRNMPQSYYNSYVWCCVAEMAEKSSDTLIEASVARGAAAVLLGGPLLPLIGIGYLVGDWMAERSIKEKIEGAGIFNLAKLSSSEMDKAKIEAGKIMGEIERNIKNKSKKNKSKKK